MRDESYAVDVAIVGAGFAGSTLAVRLAAEPSLRTALFERDEFARGVAYSTGSPRHLLNVTAEKMSAFPEEPGAFVEWLGSADPGSYVPRMHYANYLRSVFDGAMRNAANLELYRDSVVSVLPEGGGFRVRTERDSVLARCVVLALGNFSPGADFMPEALRSDPRFVRDPWKLRFDELSGDVLVIGNGLTAIDVLVELHHRDYGGRVVLLSRHGRAPQTHRDYGLPVDVTLDTRTPLRLLRSVRQAIAALEREGVDWRAVIDSLRPRAQAIWYGWTPEEQERFLRHPRPYWEVTRRRVPAEVAAVVSAFESTGRIERIAGRIRSIAKDPDGRFRALVAHSGNARAVEADWIVNCTGPQANIERIDDALIRSLRVAGLIAPHPTRIGILATADGQVLDAQGVPHPNLFALGSLLRGVLYETTSVPELRDQVKALAQRLVASFSGAFRDEEDVTHARGLFSGSL